MLCLDMIISYLGRMFGFWFYYFGLVGWMCRFFFCGCVCVMCKLIVELLFCVIYDLFVDVTLYEFNWFGCTGFYLCDFCVCGCCYIVLIFCGVFIWVYRMVNLKFDVLVLGTYVDCLILIVTFGLVV